MDSISWLPLGMRWLHLLAVIIAIGGGFFMRFVLLPSAQSTLTDEQHKSLRQALLKRWAKFVHSCVAILLLSGTYNLIIAMKTKPAPLYHTLFGIKFLMAIAIFYLVIMLASSREIAWVNEKRRMLMTLVVTLGILVVVLSGILRNLPRQTPAQQVLQMFSN